MSLEALFWTLASILLAIYLGYPLLTLAIASVRPQRRRLPPEQWQTVTILIAAHNEEAVILSKLENLMKLDYPPELMEIVVVSDGSDDRTNEIVASVTDPRVKLLAAPRQGKTQALIRAVAATTGEIIIFTDADPILERSSVKRLVTYFSDPKVGLVCGNAVYGKGEQYMGSEQEGIYWRSENLIRYAESRAYNSLVGGVGELFACRRSDHPELPSDQAHDLLMQILVRAKGQHVLFEPTAMALAQGSKVHATEYKRKVRIVYQVAYSLRSVAYLLNPFRYPVIAMQLLVHKVLRWLSGIWLWPLFPLSYLLQDQGELYVVLFYLQVAFYGLTFIGAIASKARLKLGVFGLPFYVNLIYFAAIVGVIKSLFIVPKSTWKVDRVAEKSN